MHEGSTQPIRYRFVVAGHVGPELAESFGLARLELQRCAGESVLTGTVADQAHLHGLLGRLQDLGIPIVSINPVA